MQKPLQSQKYIQNQDTMESYLLHKQAFTTLHSVPFSSLPTHAHNHTGKPHSDLVGVLIPDLVT